MIGEIEISLPEGEDFDLNKVVEELVREQQKRSSKKGNQWLLLKKFQEEDAYNRLIRESKEARKKAVAAIAEAKAKMEAIRVKREKERLKRLAEQAVKEAEAQLATEPVVPTVVVAREECVSPSHKGGFGYGRLILTSAVLATLVGVVFAVVREDKTQGATIGIPRMINEKTDEGQVVAESNTSRMLQSQATELITKPSTISIPQVKTSVIPAATIPSHGYITADTDKVKEVLTQDVVRRERLKVVGEELALLSGFDSSEGPTRAEEIRNKATKRADDLRKKADAKAEAYRKKGKNKEAERVLAKMEKDNEALLSKAEKEAKYLITKSSQTDARITQLLAEQDELQGNVRPQVVRRAVEIKTEPKPQSRTEVQVYATKVQAPEKGVMFLDNRRGKEELAVFRIVNGKKVALGKVRPGRIATMEYSGVAKDVQVAIIRSGLFERESYWSEPNSFHGGNYLWSFDGHKMLRPTNDRELIAKLPPRK